MISDVNDALLSAMRIEKSAMNFYRACAGAAHREKTRAFFSLLADEEKDHAHSFFVALPQHEESAFDLFIGSQDETGGWFGETGGFAADFDERQAMRLAMEKELALAEHLRDIAEMIDDPAIRGIYEANAVSTDRHYQLIESEYARLMGMVHESDIETYVRE